ncbi:MAG: helix-turn-helix domain-containing protein [Thermoplasmata archaeon]|nr:helix-turn-helix domain-containing protein [Thermoplasmata archaeon]
MGSPRLLLVDPDVEAPFVVDPLEDWVRVPVDPQDVQARVATLSQRASGGESPPLVDEDGLLHHRGSWVALSPLEASIALALTERFGAVVGREALSRRAWPLGAPTRNALDVQMVRFRRRVEPLGLEVRTVRSRGYLLQGIGVRV